MYILDFLRFFATLMLEIFNMHKNRIILCDAEAPITYIRSYQLMAGLVSGTPPPLRLF